jgi:hypothetical protein
MGLILNFPSSAERADANVQHGTTNGCGKPSKPTPRKPVARLSSTLIRAQPVETRSCAQARFSLANRSSREVEPRVRVRDGRLSQATAERIASRMLALSGVVAIWDAYLAAAAAHGLGTPDLAESLIQIAEAAEREWMSGPERTRYY